MIGEEGSGLSRPVHANTNNNNNNNNNNKLALDYEETIWQLKCQLQRADYDLHMKACENNLLIK
jgi:hypothetical protein